MAPVADALEQRDAVLPARDRLAIYDARARPQPRQRLDDQREAVGEVIARAAVEPDALVLFASDDPDAIVLDFMQPLVARGGAWGSCGETGGNEAER